MEITCTQCHREGKEVAAEWNIWPLIESSWAPYEYACTDHVIEALRHGMGIPAVAVEYDPAYIVPLFQITRILSAEEWQQRHMRERAYRETQRGHVYDDE